MTEYRCMTADELADWTEAATAFRKIAGQGSTKPCFDCPMAFRLAATFAGTCRRPARIEYMRQRSGPIPTYTRDEMRERHRHSNRESMRRSRARAREYTERGGRSAEPNSMAPGARLSATTREAGVVASVEVVAR